MRNDSELASLRLEGQVGCPLSRPLPPLAASHHYFCILPQLVGTSQYILPPPEVHTFLPCTVRSDKPTMRLIISESEWEPTRRHPRHPWQLPSKAPMQELHEWECPLIASGVAQVPTAQPAVSAELLVINAGWPSRMPMFCKMLRWAVASLKC